MEDKYTVIEQVASLLWFPGGTLTMIEYMFVHLDDMLMFLNQFCKETRKNMWDTRALILKRGNIKVKTMYFDDFSARTWINLPRSDTENIQKIVEKRTFLYYSLGYLIKNAEDWLSLKWFLSFVPEKEKEMMIYQTIIVCGVYFKDIYFCSKELFKHLNSQFTEKYRDILTIELPNAISEIAGSESIKGKIRYARELENPSWFSKVEEFKYFTISKFIGGEADILNIIEQTSTKIEELGINVRQVPIFFLMLKCLPNNQLRRSLKSLRIFIQSEMDMQAFGQLQVDFRNLFQNDIKITLDFTKMKPPHQLTKKEMIKLLDCRIEPYFFQGYRGKSHIVRFKNCNIAFRSEDKLKTVLLKEIGIPIGTGETKISRVDSSSFYLKTSGKMGMITWKYFEDSDPKTQSDTITEIRPEELKEGNIYVRFEKLRLYYTQNEWKGGVPPFPIDEMLIDINQNALDYHEDYPTLNPLWNLLKSDQMQNTQNICIYLDSTVQYDQGNLLKFLKLLEGKRVMRIGLRYDSQWSNKFKASIADAIVDYFPVLQGVIRFSPLLDDQFYQMPRYAVWRRSETQFSNALRKFLKLREEETMPISIPAQDSNE